MQDKQTTTNPKKQKKKIDGNFCQDFLFKFKSRRQNRETSTSLSEMESPSSHRSLMAQQDRDYEKALAHDQAVADAKAQQQQVNDNLQLLNGESNEQRRQRLAASYDAKIDRTRSTSTCKENSGNKPSLTLSPVPFSSELELFGATRTPKATPTPSQSKSAVKQDMSKKSKNNTNGGTKSSSKKTKKIEFTLAKPPADCVIIMDDFKAPARLWNQLYDYQKEGVQFFYQLYKQRSGGILGDEMGMGKTIQTVTFVASLITSRVASTKVLIITPVSLMEIWQRELGKWCGELWFANMILHGPKSAKQQSNYDYVRKHGGVVFTTYGRVTTAFKELAQHWDVIILDEGHKIKNHLTLLAKSLRQIPSTSRFLLTGTPIQNNLTELWSLFDYVCEGKLLGSVRNFHNEFETPITQANFKTATQEAKQLANELSVTLNKLLKPHFLQRTKDMLEKYQSPIADNNNNNNTSNNTIHKKQPDDDEDRNEDDQLEDIAAFATPAPTPKLKGPKFTCSLHDWIVWLPLSRTQCDIYQSFTGSGSTQTDMAARKNVLMLLTTLKTICDHPLHLSNAIRSSEWFPASLLQACHFPENNVTETDLFDLSIHDAFRDKLVRSKHCFILELPDEILLMIFRKLHLHSLLKAMTVCKTFKRLIDDDKLWQMVCFQFRMTPLKPTEPAQDLKPLTESWKDFFFRLRFSSLLNNSSKLQFLQQLLPQLKHDGHRVIIFSKFRKMLTFIELLMKREQHNYVRLDGSIASATARQLLVDQFNNDKSNFAILMTTKVGAFGLTITGADRVVIVDPSWNPADDDQAIARAFRIGQTRDVVTYRLVTCSTIEEKMYRRQVFKGSLLHATVGNKNAFSYFTREELVELLDFEQPHMSATQLELCKLHPDQFDTLPDQTKLHLQWLRACGAFGVNNHGVLWSKAQQDVGTTPVAKEAARRAQASLCYSSPLYEQVAKYQLADSDMPVLNLEDDDDEDDKIDDETNPVQRYNDLIAFGCQFEDNKNFDKALLSYMQAFRVNNSDKKLETKILYLASHHFGLLK